MSDSRDIIEARPPITIAPKDQWDDGNPDLTAWCPTCKCRAVPLSSGICGWCDTPIAGEAIATIQRRMDREREKRELQAARIRKIREQARQREAIRPRRLSLKDHIGIVLSEVGPLGRAELEQHIPQSRPRSILNAIKELREAECIKVVGKRTTHGAPAPVYDIATEHEWWQR